MILIGGLTTNHNIWSLMVDELAKNFRVLLCDNRGAGQSTQKNDGYTIDDMANDIALLMEHCAINSSFVVGHSMGGAITQKLCILHPYKVTAAIIASSIPRLHEIARLSIEMGAKLAEAGVSDSLIMESVIPWIYGNDFLEDRSRLVAELEELEKEPYPQTPDGYVGQVNAVKSHTFPELLRNIICPVLVLVRSDDLLTPVKQSKIIADLIPNSQLEILDSCGHMMMGECPEMFTAKITKFFKNLPK